MLKRLNPQTEIFDRTTSLEKCRERGPDLWLHHDRDEWLQEMHRGGVWTAHDETEAGLEG